MAILTTTYAADAAIVVTSWDSLAAGLYATSALYTNSSNYVDVLVGGTIDTAGTSAVLGDTYEIYVSASWDDDVASNLGGGIDTGFGPGDATITVDTEFVPSNMKLLTVVDFETVAAEDFGQVGHLVAVTTSQGYHWGPVSIASAFGGVVPQTFMLVLHNDGASALSATGNVVNAVGIQYTST